MAQTVQLDLAECFPKVGKPPYPAGMVELPLELGMVERVGPLFRQLLVARMEMVSMA